MIKVKNLLDSTEGLVPLNYLHKLEQFIKPTFTEGDFVLDTRNSNEYQITNILPSKDGFVQVIEKNLLIKSKSKDGVVKVTDLKPLIFENLQEIDTQYLKHKAKLIFPFRRETNVVMIEPSFPTPGITSKLVPRDPEFRNFLNAKIKEIILAIITNEELKTKLSEIVDKYFEDINYLYYRLLKDKYDKPNSR